jgi:DNA (cytosine-5)-methyltransferase 1
MIRVLDLFCGAGGASQGIATSGLHCDITGVDWQPQKKYPFRFMHQDANITDLVGYDIIHASPPCQGHSTMRWDDHTHKATVGMLEETIMRLRKSPARLWTVENVVGADIAPPETTIICGSALGCIDEPNRLYLRRHRKIWSNIPLEAPPCTCRQYRRMGWKVAGVYGSTGANRPGHGYRASFAESHTLMGISWMSQRELVEAIPPAYTRFLVRQAVDLGAI